MIRYVHTAVCLQPLTGAVPGVADIPAGASAGTPEFSDALGVLGLPDAPGVPEVPSIPGFPGALGDPGTACRLPVVVSGVDAALLCVVLIAVSVLWRPGDMPDKAISTIAGDRSRDGQDRSSLLLVPVAVMRQLLYAHHKSAICLR